MARLVALCLLAPAAAFAPSGAGRMPTRAAVRMEAEPSALSRRNAVGSALLGLSALGSMAAPSVAAEKSWMERGQLEDCATSKGFDKRLQATVKKLEGRLAKYQPGTPPYLALEQTILSTKTRFKNYADSGLLCGKDGLPHLVTSGDPAHFPEFVIPGIGFLYIAGWIGNAGRDYLAYAAKTANPTQAEIIFDVPAALKIMTSQYGWPVKAWQEFIAGDFTADEDDITVSPR